MTTIALQLTSCYKYQKPVRSSISWSLVFATWCQLQVFEGKPSRPLHEWERHPLLRIEPASMNHHNNLQTEAAKCKLLGFPAISSRLSKRVPGSQKLIVTGRSTHISCYVLMRAQDLIYSATNFTNSWRRSLKKNQKHEQSVLPNTSSTTRRRRGQGWKIVDEKRGSGDDGWNHVLPKPS